VKPGLRFLPLTPARWSHLEALFGERGACGGCWCMYWRLARPRFESQKGAGNRRAFKKLVDTGARPGILAYRDGQPIGWCAFGPREGYPVLGRSRILKPVDGRPVWSVTCLFVARPHRRRGVTVRSNRAAGVSRTSSRGPVCRRPSARRVMSRSRVVRRRGRSCGWSWTAPQN